MPRPRFNPAFLRKDRAIPVHYLECLTDFEAERDLLHGMSQLELERWEHLYWRYRRVEDCPGKARITEETADSVRQLRRLGWSFRDIGAVTNVTGARVQKSLSCALRWDVAYRFWGDVTRLAREEQTKRNNTPVERLRHLRRVAATAVNRLGLERVCERTGLTRAQVTRCINGTVNVRKLLELSSILGCLPLEVCT